MSMLADPSLGRGEEAPKATNEGTSLGATQSGRSRALSQGLLQDIVGYRLSQARLTTLTSFAKHVGTPLSLRPVDYSLLVLLHDNGHATPKQLATAVAVSGPKLTILLDQLQQRGLIERERSDTDRRSQRVRLSAQGQVLTQDAMDRSQAMESEIHACLSRGERALLIELLDKISRLRIET